MIPDTTFVFNQYDAAPGHFDDYEARLRHLLHQDATQTLDDGRHLLHTCSVCKQPWYKAGTSKHACLISAQLTKLGASQHADIDALHLLPTVLCPICSTVHQGCIFSIGEFLHRKGYCFLWESATQQHIRLHATVCQLQGLALDTLFRVAPYPCTETALKAVRCVLAWIEETWPASHAVRTFTAEESHHLARRCPAGYTADGQALLWRGYVWNDTCPALGGDILALLAVSTLPFAPSPFASLLMSWSILAQTLRLGL